MTRKEWIIVLLPVLLVWLFDHLIKVYVDKHLLRVISMGLIQFRLDHNAGMMFGMFSELPPVLRVVTLSTGGAFILSTFLILQYLLPIKLMMLRMGSSFFIAGIIGNVTDRILWGHVVDYVQIVIRKIVSPPFNLADVSMWIGAVLITAVALRDGELLWPNDLNRKKIWINHRFQLKFTLVLISSGILLSMVSGVYVYTYFVVTLKNIPGVSTVEISKFTNPFITIYFVISLFFISYLGAVGRIVSHRTAGPIYAFQRYINELIAGKLSHKLILRQKDDFRELEILAEKLKSHMVSQNDDLMKRFHEKKDVS